MKKLTDDILNRYVDGELTNSEAAEMFDLIKNDDDALNKLKAHKMVDRLLRDMEVYQAPRLLTDNIMSRINKKFSKKAESSNFIKIILSIFCLLIIGTLGYFFSLARNENISASGEDISFVNDIKNFLLGIDIEYSLIFQNNLILYIGIFLTVMLLFSALFLFDSHREFKQKLQNL